MRVIVHVSDLHFGRVDPVMPPVLARAINAVRPDIVVVSGDLTQRARRAEFLQARAFLDTLPEPRIVVPGNHDIPMHDVLSRWLRPLDKYKHYIAADTEPFHADSEVAVLGLNTARALVIKNGRLNHAQLTRAREKLAPGGEALTRVVVTHHPFDPGEGHDLIGHAAMAMTVFAELGVDLILSGHLHVSRHSASAARYRLAGHSAVLIQAGTATSSRHRGERNAWNVIRIARPDIAIETMTWEEGKADFTVSATSHFRLGAQGWARVHGAKAPEG